MFMDLDFQVLSHAARHLINNHRQIKTPPGDIYFFVAHHRQHSSHLEVVSNPFHNFKTPKDSPS